jgi:hypothetical protein
MGEAVQASSSNEFKLKSWGYVTFLRGKVSGYQAPDASANIFKRFSSAHTQDVAVLR